jgi:hypothetical protein
MPLAPYSDCLDLHPQLDEDTDFEDFVKHKKKRKVSSSKAKVCEE